jgi:hypothetical protein
MRTPPLRRRRCALLALSLSLAVVAGGLAPAAAGSSPRAGGTSLDVTITGGPSSGRVPLNVTLDASASGGTAPYEYSWALANGSVLGSGPVLVHTFTVAGTYTVTVSVLDAFGEPGNASWLVGALPPALTVVAGATPSSLAAGNATFLEANASGGVPPYSYVWSGLPAGCYGGDYASIRCVPVHAGGYTVTVNVTDTVGTIASSYLGLVVNPGSGSGPGPGDGGSGSGLPLWELATILGAAAIAGLVIGVVLRPRLGRRR